VEECLHRNNPHDLRMIRHSSASARARRPAQLLGLILACTAVVQAQTPGRASRSVYAHDVQAALVEHFMTSACT